MCYIINIEVFAKVNLSLDVLGLRSDGYHEISSIFHSLKVSDKLSIKKAPKKSLRTNNNNLPINENNLILKAIRQLELALGRELNCAIDLEKRIPIAAGLGGGSADAAGALLLANRLFDLNLTQDELALIGAKIGADIPFMFRGGGALVEGIGEKITPIEPAPKWGVLLIKPPFGIRTAGAYAHLDKDLEALEHFDAKALVKAIADKNYHLTGALLGNSFSKPIFSECPSLKIIVSELRKLGVEYVSLSGSGPTLFALTETEEAAIELGKELYENLTIKFPNWNYLENKKLSNVIQRGTNQRPWIYPTTLSKRGFAWGDI